MEPIIWFQYEHQAHYIQGGFKHACDLMRGIAALLGLDASYRVELWIDGYTLKGYEYVTTALPPGVFLHPSDPNSCPLLVYARAKRAKHRLANLLPSVPYQPTLPMAMPSPPSSKRPCSAQTQDLHSPTPVRPHASRCYPETTHDDLGCLLVSIVHFQHHVQELVEALCERVTGSESDVKIPKPAAEALRGLVGGVQCVHTKLLGLIEDSTTKTDCTPVSPSDVSRVQQTPSTKQDESVSMPLFQAATEIASVSHESCVEACHAVAKKLQQLLGHSLCTLWLRGEESTLWAFVGRKSRSTCRLDPHDEDSYERLTQEALEGSPLWRALEDRVLSRGGCQHTDVQSNFSDSEDGDNIYYPITAGDRVLGVCEVRLATGFFTSSQIDLLRSFLLLTVPSLECCLLRQDLMESNTNTAVLLDLVQVLSKFNLDGKHLCESIIDVSRQLLRADRCSLFLVDHAAQELIPQTEGEMRIPMSEGVAGYVARTGETVNIEDVNSDDRFSIRRESTRGNRKRSILCSPIRHELAIVAVAQLEGKDIGPFTKDDEMLFATFCEYSGVSIQNMVAHEHLLNEKKTMQAVLFIVGELQKIDICNTDLIVEKILWSVKELVQCDRCSLLEVEKETSQLKTNVDGRTQTIAMQGSIAGEVAQTGKRINRLCEIDGETVSTLCMPVSYANDVIAVMQLVGKEGGFTEEHERILGIFSEFAAMCLRNARLVEFMKKSEQQNRELFESQLYGPSRKKRAQQLVSNEVVERYLTMKLTEEEERLKVTPEFPIHQYNIHSPKHERLIPILLAVIRDLGLLKACNCPEDIMCRFIVAASRKYRQVPYHNFTHAFDVTQTLGTMIARIMPRSYFTETECFALMVSGICHDMDHMGLNNSFQMKAETPLGVLSSSSGSKSVLEVHHCNLAIDILSDPSYNVFCGLPPDEVKDAWKVLVESILGTDMARHGELLSAFEELKAFDSCRPEMRRLLITLMLKCCDISNIAKPFDISSIWGQYLVAEFYCQGDAERAYGLDVTPTFDRQNKTELASGQVAFIKSVGIPLFTILADVLPELSFFLEEALSNLEVWERLLGSTSS